MAIFPNGNYIWKLYFPERKMEIKSGNYTSLSGKWKFHVETRIPGVENGNSIWKLEFPRWKMEIISGN
ncbi:MAG: hypothetical protein H0X31_21195 [Nostocaceae cyanobacterium]|nr:hypothetical protein [Nostocaceae cyanobacterium]